MKKLFVKTILPFLKNNLEIKFEYKSGIAEFEIWLTGIKLFSRSWKVQGTSTPETPEWTSLTDKRNKANV